MREAWISLTSSTNWWKRIAGYAWDHDKIHLLPSNTAAREEKLISYHISHFIYSASPRERPPHNDTKDISFIYCPSTRVFVSRWVAGKQTSVGTRRIEIAQWSLPSGCRHSKSRLTDYCYKGGLVLFCCSGVVLVFPLGWLCSSEARVCVVRLGEGHRRHVHCRVGGSIGTRPTAWQSALNAHIPFFVFLSDYPLALNMLMGLASPSVYGSRARAEITYLETFSLEDVKAPPSLFLHRSPCAWTLC